MCMGMGSCERFHWNFGSVRFVEERRARHSFYCVDAQRPGSDGGTQSDARNEKRQVRRTSEHVAISYVFIDSFSVVDSGKPLYVRRVAAHGSVHVFGNSTKFSVNEVSGNSISISFSRHFCKGKRRLALRSASEKPKSTRLWRNEY